MNTVQIQLLYDNIPGAPGTRALWGFSAMIEFGPEGERQRLLFDTGSNGRVLLANMAALGVTPTGIHWLFLSHQHWDHIGGLDSILELNPDIQCVLHQGFSKHLLADLLDLGIRCLIVDDDPLEFVPDIHSTGLVASEPPEHALVLQTPDGAAVISGCAHPGMSALVAKANGFLPTPVRWAIGGFHLMYADAAAIAQEIRTLGDLGIKDVLATHCTGEAGIAAFDHAFGEHARPGGAGAQLWL
ncbi:MULTISPECIES: MBL fold metallo-hydrolase [Thiorhodovibrio]|uniref:MBL fold metallo-hydrolase n=1 Tax=Thiorhodovibrio TaxID=61593 RepID=UPI001913C473|nr:MULTISPECIES: MBL fold metallo-hydrolase [Thiorhodovibrio]MBK5970838.1 metal-dependent hydrolase [Thiorhodovibrio winogradskyi]WPL10770.1 Metallo-beta-lactamase superfamily protein [Thiorhodovibrio litoralis]